MPVITITYKNATRTIREWSEITGIPVKTIHTRLRKNWPVSELFKPSRKEYSTKKALGTPMKKIRDRQLKTTDTAKLIIGYYFREKIKKLKEDFEKNAPTFLKDTGRIPETNREWQMALCD